MFSKNAIYVFISYVKVKYIYQLAICAVLQQFCQAGLCLNGAALELSKIVERRCGAGARHVIDPTARAERPYQMGTFASGDRLWHNRD